MLSRMRRRRAAEGSVVNIATLINDHNPTFTRGSSALHPMTGATAANDVARRWQIQVGSRMVNLDLIEPQRTNLVLRSQNLSVTPTWDLGNTNVGTTATKLVENNDVAKAHYAAQGYAGTADNTVYTWSAVVTAAELTEFQIILQDRAGVFHSAVYNLSNATISGITAGDTARMVALSGGAYLCSYTCNLGSGASVPYGGPHLYDTARGGVTYNGNGVSGMFFQNSQLEAGPWPTSRIVTTTAAATRTADVRLSDVLAANFSAIEGTYFAILVPVGWNGDQPATSPPTSWRAWTGDQPGSTPFMHRSSATAASLTAGTAAETIVTHNLADRTLRTLAMVYDSASLRGYVDGAASGTPDATPGGYSSPDSIQIGGEPMQAFCGFVGLLFIPKACSAAEIAALHADVAVNVPTFVH